MEPSPWRSRCKALTVLYICKQESELEKQIIGYVKIDDEDAKTPTGLYWVILDMIDEVVLQ